MNKEWHEYTDPENRFVVSFPELPNHVNTKTYQGENKEEFTFETISFEEQKNTGLREYTIIICNIPAMAQQEATRKAYYNNLSKGMPGSSSKTVFFQSLSAMESRRRENNQHVRSLHVADKAFKLLYMIMISGSEAFINSPDAKRFIESFRFLP